MYPYLVNGIDSTATLNRLRNDMEARAAETIAGIEARIAEELKVCFILFLTIRYFVNYY